MANMLQKRQRFLCCGLIDRIPREAFEEMAHDNRFSPAHCGTAKHKANRITIFVRFGSCNAGD
jgi:hypothetical protein